MDLLTKIITTIMANILLKIILHGDKDQIKALTNTAKDLHLSKIMVVIPIKTNMATRVTMIITIIIRIITIAIPLIQLLVLILDKVHPQEVHFHL